MNRRLINLGTLGQMFTPFFEGLVLSMDTAISVLQTASQKVKAVHLVPDLYVPVPLDILRRSLERSGTDGAALIEAYSCWIIRTNPSIRAIVERFIADASQVFIIPSAGGGTANGMFEEFVKIVESLHCP